MSDNVLSRVGSFLNSQREWYQLPKLLAMPRLVEIRDQLRRENLHDTEEPAMERKDPPTDLDPAIRSARTVDGSYNDLHVPAMGSCGRRFGRNVR